MRLLLLLVVVFAMVFWFLRPPPRPLPTEGVRLKGVEFYLFPEEEGVERLSAHLATYYNQMPPTTISF
ncbi:hypothetical protein [Thermus scotoductus]|uniref:hypothetical protein n=1 Tax=Thermus scotoductus TaxID=37636 RepID=UPI001C12C2D4|nr:hypothetical protein [Thermus scotoductus]